MISPEALDEMDRIVRETCVDPNLTGAENRATWARYITPERVRALLSAARGSGVPEGWRPIETAPRDETAVLGWSAEYGARQTYYRFYGVGSSARADYARGRGPRGAWDWSEPHNNWAASWEPTHWQPLPAAPSPVSVLLMGGSGEDLGVSIASRGGTPTAKSDSDGGL